MSATPEQIAIDEKALEAAAENIDMTFWFSDAKQARVAARAAITAYLTATKDAQAERVRVLESAIGDLETIRSLGKAAFGGDWGVYSEEFGPHKGAVYIHANDVDADEDGLARDYGKRICEMADNDDDEATAAFIVACNVFVRRLLAKTSRAALRGAP